MRHLLRDDDLAPDEQLDVLALAAQMKAEPHAYLPLAGPKSVAVLFDKSSTRTRVSFAVGIAELGGNAVMLDSSKTQAQRGEPICDTARVLGRMTSAIAWRTYAQSDLAEMAAHAGVPVINALSDAFHPCQLLADLLTIRQHRGTPAGLTVAYLGDGSNNMAQSYLLAGTTAGMHVRIACPPSDAPDPAVIEDARAIAAHTGGSVQVTAHRAEAMIDADVVVTDTWASMGQDHDPQHRAEIMAPYAITAQSMADAADDAIVLHCLPAYRGLEIEHEVLEGAHSVVWDEAENRIHAQKALLTWLLQQ